MTRALRLVAPVLVLALGAVPGFADGELSDLEREIERATALEDADHPDSALALYAEILPAVRTTENVELIAGVLRKAGLLHTRHGDPVIGDELLAERVTVAEAAADSSLLVRALYDLASGIDTRGRSPRTEPIYERTIAVARACGEPIYAARAELRLARRELRAGTFPGARARLERALVAFEERGAPDERDRYGALFLLGILHARMGAPDSARTRWEEVLAWARTENPNLHGQSLVNLGRLDVSAGNTARAAERWREAYRILRDSGHLRGANVAAQNAALALRELGRYDEAAEMLEEQWSLAHERGWADYEGSALVNLGAVEQSRRRFGNAAVSYRKALTVLADLDDAERSVNAMLGLARALAQLDSAGTAVAVLEDAMRTYRDRLDFEKRTQLDQDLGEMLLAAGRPEEARASARRGLALAREKGYPREILTALLRMAEAERELGHAEPLETHLREAAALWEAQRSFLADPEWREVRGHRGARVFTELARVVLEKDGQKEAKLAEAYTMLQRYKARTLRERLAADDEPDSALAAPQLITPRKLREGVLRPGDLLLDFYVGPRCSFLFAMTRENARVIPLGGAQSELFESVVRYRELVAAPPEGKARIRTEALLDAAANALTPRLLAEAMADVGACRRILFVPDGPLHLLSLGSLRWEGQPLVEHCEIVRVPSTEFLTPPDAAGRPEDDTTESGTLLAIAGRYGANASELRGTVREVQALGRRFRDAEIRTEPAPGEAAIAAGELARHQVLHFAAHTHVDDQRPGNSGIRLGGADSRPGPAEDEGFLRASTIASLKLPARLAVLSGCESAGGRLVTGEGTLGLTSAFLSAGVPTVVATLWPVDDRVTPRLMEMFYERLGRGDTAAAALRAAQRSLRDDPATRLPFYWAGFTLVGAGDLSVDLDVRPRILRAGWLLLLAAGLALVATFIGMAAPRVRARRV